MVCRVILTISMFMALDVPVAGYAQDSGNVVEFSLAWPNKEEVQKEKPGGSTHELAYRRCHKSCDGSKAPFWITGQNYGYIARVTLDGKVKFYPMKIDSTKKGELPKSGPHGIVFDAQGQLWVSLEFLGMVVRVDDDGEIVEEIDVRLHVKGTKMPINTSPHGIELGSDGKTIWFTGKKTSTIGKINPDRSVEHFELPTIGAVPIYLATGPEGDVWCTELVGNKIARITPNGKVTEYGIPTPNSRPIAITPGPDGNMWFSEEAGNKVARLNIRDGKITEFPVPPKQQNVILGGIAFDSKGNLWTHSYVDQKRPRPEGPDHIIKIDKAIKNAATGDWIPITYYEVRSRNTVMHRITQGPDGNIWFTELGIDKLGKLTIGRHKR